MAMVARANCIRLMGEGPISDRKDDKSNQQRAEKPKNASYRITTPIAVASEGAFPEVSSSEFVNIPGSESDVGFG